MSENTSANPLVANPETGKLKRCCNIDGKPLKQCGCGSGGATSLGILKAVPSSGSGRGTYAVVTINEFGDYVESTTLIPVIIPRIWHVN